MLGDARLLDARSKSDLECAREAYFEELRQHADQRPAELVVDKLPLNMLAAPYLYCLFPHAPLVFVQRHPCDAVLSCFMQSFVANEFMACFLELETAAKFYDAAMRLWTRCRNATPLRVQTIVYEDLVAEPRSTLKPLIEFLGLDWRLAARPSVDSKSSWCDPNPKLQSGCSAPYEGIHRAMKRDSKELSPVLPILMRLGRAASCYFRLTAARCGRSRLLERLRVKEPQLIA